jgi:predicted TIM-barrel fold metal-dependent hydrolase
MSPEHAAWLDLVREEALDPDLPICDAHHHLWDHPRERYLVEELHEDTGAGHRVVRTVYVDCLSGYRTDGPEALRPVGETEFALAQAELGEVSGGAVIAGIVGYADLRLGSAVAEVLETHVAVGGGRFRGIRHATSWDPDPSLRRNHVGSPPGLMATAEFRDGLAVLGRMGLSFDAWMYFPQLPELADAARAVPETTIVLDHLGGPVGVGPYADRAESLARWRTLLADVATCPNVVLKLGGIGMPDFGVAWHQRELPPTSADLAGEWADHIRFAIDQFGPSRCLFESNYPVDRKGCSYVVLWNAFKRIAEPYGREERAWLFHDTAATAYRLGPV